MNEEEVKFCVKGFFEENGFKVEKEFLVSVFSVDLLAVKDGKKFFVECRGDSYLRSHEIHVMIGQTVSKMIRVGSGIHYCLAMPLSLATYLKGFGVEGIKALGLNLLIVLDSGSWKGEVCYLDSGKTIDFLLGLKKGDWSIWYLWLLESRDHPI